MSIFSTNLMDKVKLLFFPILGDFTMSIFMKLSGAVSRMKVHTYEGSDDMPAHIKASILGNSLTIPITNGKMNLGTWQGIYFGEHRDYGGSRRIVITLNGECLA